MLKKLKNIIEGSHNDTAAKPAGVMARLQRDCARQAVDRERRAPGQPNQPVASQRKVQSQHDTQLDLDKTPHVVADSRPRVAANDTRLELHKQRPAVAAASNVAVAVSPAAPATPSVLQRLRNWFRGSATPRIDRRGAPRFPFAQVHPKARVLVGPAQWPAQVTDISLTGIGLILGLRNRLGADVQLALQDRSKGSSFPVKAKVKRLVLLADGRWLTCCAFDRPLDERGLNAMR